MGLSKLLSSGIRSNIGFTSYTRLLGKSCSSNAASEESSGEDKDKKVDGGKKGLVAGVYSSEGRWELSAAAARADAASGGRISHHLNDLSDRLQLGAAHLVTDVPGYSAVALASYGPRGAGHDALEELDLDKENVRWGVGAGVRALQERGCGEISVDPGAAPGAAAEAAELASWRFQDLRTDKRDPQPKLSLLGDAGAEAEAGAEGEAGADGEAGGEGEGPGAEWKTGGVLGRAQNWARYLSDMPANKMAPVDLAQAALDVLCPLGVQVTARDRDWLQAQRMAAFLAVARGSCEAPVLLEAHWAGGGAARPVLLAAKGVTFDSGGLCLKQPRSMVENRGSMAGAAVVLAALRVIAELKVPMNVRAVVPLCENMVSGQCVKVGDVVRALNGLSIVVEDTDLEGRLLLADALVYGQAAYRPRLVVDVATLTHGVLLATGGGAFGCFSNDAGAWRAARDAGAASGDRPWRFPLWNFYHKQVTDDPSVDLRNKGSGKASPCLGAAFLKNFICAPWLHMDITGVGKLAHAPAPPYLDARRMTGRPARTLAGLLRAVAACGGEGDAGPGK